MGCDSAGKSCGLQVIPAYRIVRLQARLAAVESIHKRIKRLREAKGLSQERLAKLVGVAYQSVQEWERERGTAPQRKRQAAVAVALGVTVHELMTGQQPSLLTLNPKEELVLEMFRELTPEQQREQVNYIRALYHANVVTGGITKKPLRTISNEDVERAFGKVPIQARARPAKKPSKSQRGPGAAMDDFD
jgi:transcriptional regulator with XRE-family HTH domain